jgi:hypothetical protein
MTVNEGGSRVATLCAGSAQSQSRQGFRRIRGQRGSAIPRAARQRQRRHLAPAIKPVKKRKGASEHQGLDSRWITSKTNAGFNLYAVIGNAAATGKGGGVTDEDITGVPALFVEWDDGASIEEQMQRWQSLEVARADGDGVNRRQVRSLLLGAAGADGAASSGGCIRLD